MWAIKGGLGERVNVCIQDKSDRGSVNCAYVDANGIALAGIVLLNWFNWYTVSTPSLAEYDWYVGGNVQAQNPSSPPSNRSICLAIYHGSGVTTI